ncbi:hypothetical protein [Streptomyces fuscichromogenes]|uniref:Uncharacterized protein n=1 Tax=Streptomyces fuscichromogenes TaxID=1324013 RepID=A0A917UFN4_9ACTN|nr:hypothetical protein [Streptomyces fuscichromogenes]GGM86001.1 hypothetical protein GCM10011578_001000 [Streptomyces fuscichromogenes]
MTGTPPFDPAAGARGFGSQTSVTPELAARIAHFSPLGRRREAGVGRCHADGATGRVGRLEARQLDARRLDARRLTRA